jgi:hypothetical protein
MARSLSLAAVACLLAGCAFGSGTPLPGDDAAGGGGGIDAPRGAADAPPGPDDGAPADAATIDVIIDAAPCIAGDRNQLFAGHCYSYFGPARNWPTVRANCEALGPTTHIVTLESAPENDFLLAFVNADPIWTGANDMAVEMTWMWITGTSLSATYANWENGEPNDSGTEDCAYFKSSGEWADVECGNTYSYVCERD